MDYVTETARLYHQQAQRHSSASPFQTQRQTLRQSGIIHFFLRRGDIITRLNATQVAFLLPQATEADAGAVSDRLKRSFYAQFPAGCTLSFAFSTISVGNGPWRG